MHISAFVPATSVEMEANKVNATGIPLYGRRLPPLEGDQFTGSPRRSCSLRGPKTVAIRTRVYTFRSAIPTASGAAAQS